MLNILFLCTGNSCRSQMAEGWARALRADEVEAYSAGVERHGVNPRAVAVMAEAGVDISGQNSKLVSELPRRDFDWVLTLCGHAAETCPAFPGAVRMAHIPFDDPPALTRGMTDEQAILDVYRRVRDDIRAFVESLPGTLPGAENADILSGSAIKL